MNMIVNKNKSKPVIEKISIPEEKMHELNSSLKRGIKKPAIIRKYCGGTCTCCGEIPKYKISYDVGQGNRLIEFYCDKDLPNKSELDNRLQNINLEEIIEDSGYDNSIRLI